MENNRLLAILRTQIDLRQALRQASRLEAENRILRAESRPTFLAKVSSDGSGAGVDRSDWTVDANVLITGEHGTGKKLSQEPFTRLSTRATKQW